MRVIIAGTNRTRVEFDGDDAPETIHYGLYAPELVSCASLMAQPWEGQPAYQVRGMATEPTHQGKGYGRLLLAGIEDDLRQHAATEALWCNARTTAVPFYEKSGWTPVGDTFEVPGVGPHLRLFKRLV